VLHEANCEQHWCDLPLQRLVPRSQSEYPACCRPAQHTTGPQVAAHPQLIMLLLLLLLLLSLQQLLQEVQQHGR
jgi:hypothetical protein